MQLARRSLAIAWAIVLAAALDARALPDLVPEVFGVSVGIGNVDPGDVVEGCAGGETGRRLLRFSIRARNVGASDLVMGDPGCPDCAQNPGAVCANPLFHCSEAHGHAHFEGFAEMELLTPGGAVVGQSFKQSFCLLDAECANPQYSCGFQGITAGCADVYDSSLPCQYIDLTDLAVPNGSYVLRVRLDPDGAIEESDDVNNVVTVPVDIGVASTPTCPVYASTDVPKPLPDLGSGVSTLTVPAGLPVERVRVVALNGVHSYFHDLEIHLRSPSGTDVTIVDRECGDHDAFSLDLADGATTAIPCPPDDGGVHQPSHALSPFLGESPGGTWSLEVFDREANDDGTLHGWGLEVCGPCGNGVLDAGEVCDDGNALGGDCCSADCQSIGLDGASCSDGNLCTTGETCSAGTCTDGSPVACDPCLACYPAVGCARPLTTVCQAPSSRGSKLSLRRPGDPDRDRLTWRWNAAAPVLLGDFGLPGTSTDMRFCLFDQSGLRLSASAPAGGTCDGRPCWQTTTGVTYRDPDMTPDGLSGMSLRPGSPPRASVLVRGAKANLDLPPLDLQLPVTARLERDDGSPICWEATYHSTSRRSPEAFEARSE